MLCKPYKVTNGLIKTFETFTKDGKLKKNTKYQKNIFSKKRLIRRKLLIIANSLVPSLNFKFPIFHKFSFKIDKGKRVIPGEMAIEGRRLSTAIFLVLHATQD